MISPDYCATLARYNEWQNGSLIAAASGLDDAARGLDRGAFFGSIAGTFSHLLWADQMWMSRLDGWDKPDVSGRASATWVPDWARLVARRQAADRRIRGWAEALDTGALQGDLIWFSGLTGREVTLAKWRAIAHFFNHQTHHRGQIHAMLTAAGAQPDDTDLFLMPQGD